jgi:hypothetical protein
MGWLFFFGAFAKRQIPSAYVVFTAGVAIAVTFTFGARAGTVGVNFFF